MPNPEPPAPGLDVAGIEARCAAATPGPWGDPGNGNVTANGMLLASVPRGKGAGASARRDADVAFIAHARTDIPALLAALRAAEQENVRLCQIELEYRAMLITGQRPDPFLKVKSVDGGQVVYEPAQHQFAVEKVLTFSDRGSTP